MQQYKEPRPRRHGNRWRISIRKFGTRSFKTFATPEECLDWWSSENLLKHAAPDQPKTIGEICDAILGDVTRLYRPATHSFWKHHFSTIKRAFDGAMGVHEIAARDIETFFSSVRRKDGERYSATTGDIHWRCLSRIFVHAKKRGLIMTNPLDGDELRAIRPREEPRTFAFTRDQVLEILENVAGSDLGRGDGQCHDPRFHAAVIAFPYYTSARLSEMARVLVSDVDLSHGLLHIRGVGRRTKRGRSNRIPADFKDSMDWLLQRSGQHGHANLLGIGAEGIKTIFRRRATALKKVGKLTCHVMRHSAASALAAAGTFGRRISWSSIAATKKILATNFHELTRIITDF